MTLALLAAVFLLIKLPTLPQKNTWLENDERIYLSLAQNLALRGEYSLEGTPVLEQIDPQVYDRPLFHHPPLAIWMMLPTCRAFGPAAAVLVSWAGHLLAAIALYLILGVELAATRANRLWARLVLGLFLLDPLLVFSAKHIWLDSMMTGLAMLALALFRVGLDQVDSRRRWFCVIGSGVVLGAALLTKAPAIIAGIAFPLFAWQQRRPLREALLLLSVPALVALGVALPWFIHFHSTYGMLLPDWIAPTQAMLAKYPILAELANRPAYYFVLGMVLFYPGVMVIPAVLLLREPSERRSLGAWLGTVMAVLSAFTLLAASGGHSYQVRYLTLAVLPCYVLLARYLALPQGGMTQRIILLQVCAVLNAAVAVYFTVNYKAANLCSLFELLYR